MLESLPTEPLRYVAIAFPLLIPLFFYNRLFTISDHPHNSAKELSVKDETVIKCTFPLAMVVAFTVPPYLQWRLFRDIPSELSLFSWRLSQDLIFPLAGYLIQGLAVAFLVHFLIAKFIFGGRFDSDVFCGKPRKRNANNPYSNAYSFKWFVHPAGKVRVMLWLGGLIAMLANIAFEGTYLQVDHDAVRQNILWVDKKDYPISSIQKAILTPRYGRYGRVRWSVNLHLKDGSSIPLLGAFGEFSRLRINQLCQVLKTTSNESIEIYENNIAR